VIAARRAALPEIVGDAGLLVDPDDSHGVADAIRTVLTDAVARRRLQWAGQTRAASMTWAKAARRFLDLYRKLAGRHSGESLAVSLQSHGSVILRRPSRMDRIRERTRLK